MAYTRINKLTVGKTSHGGRNNQGILTIPRNSFTKKIYRFIDLHRKIFPGIGATITDDMYDPNRSGRIGLLVYRNSTMLYTLLTVMPVKQKKLYNLCQPKDQQDRGWSNFLNQFSTGAIISNIELVPGRGGQISRSAGACGVVLKKTPDGVLVKIKSGAKRLFHPNCVAVYGLVSNQNHFLRNFKKAGTSRKLGIRPHVRACSKNPVDHPLGGRTRGGQPQNKNGLLRNSATGRARKSHHLELLSARRSRLKQDI